MKAERTVWRNIARRLRAEEYRRTLAGVRVNRGARTRPLSHYRPEAGAILRKEAW